MITSFLRQEIALTVRLLLFTLLMMTSDFVTAPKYVYVKLESRVLTHVVCLVNIVHGFVLVKSWPLITCDTAFYVIKNVID